MSLQEWERDVRNRQRNIVFPDTVLNEGRFYRNIASGKAVFSLGQRLSLLIIVVFFMALTTLGFVGAISEFLAEDDPRFRTLVLWPSLYLLAMLLFWLFLAVKGLVPAGPTGKRRAGYRRSNKF
jgi:hypothetical protein